MLTKTKLKL